MANVQAAFDKRDKATARVADVAGREDIILQKAEEKLNENFNLADRKRQAEDRYFEMSRNNSSKFDQMLSENLAVLGPQAFSAKREMADQAFQRLRDVMQTQDQRRTQLGDTFEARLNDLKEVARLANEELQRAESMQRIELQEAQLAEQKRATGFQESFKIAEGLVEEQTDIFGRTTSNRGEIFGGLAEEFGINIGSGQSGNIPDRNNNPGNVKAGGIGDQYAIKDANGRPMTDEQGHLIFANPEDGYRAMASDLSAKIAGRTRNQAIVAKINEKGVDNLTLDDIGRGYAEHGGWGQGVAQIYSQLTGQQITPDVKVKDLDKNMLFQAVARQEGFTGAIDVASGVDPNAPGQREKLEGIREQFGQVSPDRIAEAQGQATGEFTNPDTDPPPITVDQIETQQDVMRFLTEGGDANELRRMATTPEALKGIEAIISSYEGESGTQAERTEAGYAQRIIESTKIIDELEDDPDFNIAGFWRGLERSRIPIPFLSNPNLVPEIFISSKTKQLIQAQRNFVNAVLRKESGAVISDDEFANAAKQYFPQMGDNEAELANKRQNRETVQKALELGAGPALEKLQKEIQATQDKTDTPTDLSQQSDEEFFGDSDLNNEEFFNQI